MALLVLVITRYSPVTTMKTGLIRIPAVLAEVFKDVKRIKVVITTSTLIYVGLIMWFIVTTTLDPGVFGTRIAFPMLMAPFPGDRCFGLFHVGRAWYMVYAGLHYVTAVLFIWALGDRLSGSWKAELVRFWIWIYSGIDVFTMLFVLINVPFFGLCNNPIWPQNPCNAPEFPCVSANVSACIDCSAFPSPLAYSELGQNPDFTRLSIFAVTSTLFDFLVGTFLFNLLLRAMRRAKRTSPSLSKKRIRRAISTQVLLASLLMLLGCMVLAGAITYSSVVDPPYFYRAASFDSPPHPGEIYDQFYTYGWIVLFAMGLNFVLNAIILCLFENYMSGLVRRIISGTLYAFNGFMTLFLITSVIVYYTPLYGLMNFYFPGFWLKNATLFLVFFLSIAGSILIDFVFVGLLSVIRKKVARLKRIEQLELTITKTLDAKRARSST